MIYFHSPAPGLLALLAIDAKNEKEDLTDADLKAIRSAIAEIRRAVPDDQPR